MFEHVKSAVHFGIELPEHEPIIQWDAVQKRKQSVVKQLTDGVRYLMNKNKVSVVNGKASFLSAHELLIESEGKSEIIQAKQIIIASGAAPAALPLHLLMGNGSFTARMPCHFLRYQIRFVLLGEG